MSCSKSQSGNVLFYILIAVALLAALSYAVSETSRGNTQQVSNQQARLHASEILAYADTVAKAVVQLRLRGCLETELSFQNDVVTVGYTNANAPGDESCHIFAFNGGGVLWQPIPAEFLDTSHSAKNWYGQPFYPAGTCVVDIGTTSNSAGGFCDSDGDEDLLIIYPWIKREICLALNDLVDMNNPDGDPPTDNALAWSTSFSGSFSGALEIGNGADLNSFRGKKSGCFEGSSHQAGGYHFYHVLLAR